MSQPDGTPRNSCPKCGRLIATDELIDNDGACTACECKPNKDNTITEGDIMTRQNGLRRQYKRAYVGIKKDGTRQVFMCWNWQPPTKEKYGYKYAAIIGAFYTRRGAEFMAKYGKNNPHLQTVADAERIAKLQQ